MLHKNINDNGWGFYIDIEDYKLIEKVTVPPPTIEIPDNDSYIDFYNEYSYDDYRYDDYSQQHNTELMTQKNLTNILIKTTSKTIIAIISVSCVMYFIL
jgi:hypothetical protein